MLLPGPCSELRLPKRPQRLPSLPSASELRAQLLLTPREPYSNKTASRLQATILKTQRRAIIRGWLVCNSACIFPKVELHCK
eukprot:10847549-Alexandrium_andersonii.AAC.1